MNNNDEIYEIDLVKLFQVLLKKFYIIALCALIGGGATFAYSKYYIKPTYQSKALMYVNNQNISLGSSGVKLSSTDINASKSLVDTYAVILKTRNTLETVARKANLDYTYEKLNSMVSAGAVNETEIFSVTVTSTDPEEACLIANTIATVFPDKVAEIVNGTSAKIVDYGVVNTRKVAPNCTRYTLIGILVGAFLACICIVIGYLLDDTIRGEDYISENFEIPVLAIIPNLFNNKNSYKKNKNYYKYYDKYGYSEKSNKKSKKRRASEETESKFISCENMHFDAKEAYKLLRTNIQFTLPKFIKCKVIGITSAIRSEGKSTTSINLAYTIAESNKKVLLIDGDMRLPSINNKLDIKNDVGLSDLIIGNATINEVINKYKNNSYFDVMLSGSVPPNPSELLGSPVMTNIIESLAEKYDYILIDLPPVNIVSDALVTTHFINGVVITVREGLTDKRSLTECVNQLQFIKANILGFILNDSKGGGTYYNKNRYYSKKYGKYRYKKYGYYNNSYYGYRGGYKKNYYGYYGNRQNSKPREKETKETESEE